MNKLSKFSKISLFLFASSGVIWIGSYITRLSLFYRLFQPAEYQLKDYVNDQNIGGIFETLIAAVSINLIFYVIMIIAFVLFLITSKINLKQNGWLFISMVLILFTAPFEIYLLSIDYQMVFKIFYGNFDSHEILTLVIKRFTTLSSFPIVEILGYIAVLYLFLFQPLSGSHKRLAE